MEIKSWRGTFGCRHFESSRSQTVPAVNETQLEEGCCRAPKSPGRASIAEFEGSILLFELFELDLGIRCPLKLPFPRRMPRMRNLFPSFLTAEVGSSLFRPSRRGMTFLEKLRDFHWNNAGKGKSSRWSAITESSKLN